MMWSSLAHTQLCYAGRSEDHFYCHSFCSFVPCLVVLFIIKSLTSIPHPALCTSHRLWAQITWRDRRWRTLSSSV